MGYVRVIVTDSYVMFCFVLKEIVFVCVCVCVWGGGGGDEWLYVCVIITTLFSVVNK